jgi:hypothetical protein
MARPLRNLLFATGGIAIVVALTVTAFKRYEWRARGERMPKIIATFDQLILMYVNESKELERRLVKSDTRDWRTLDDQERVWLIDELARQGDAGQWWKDLVTKDVWGNPLRVEVRRPESGIEFRIISAGPDGRFDTDDDYDSVDKRRYLREDP